MSSPIIFEKGTRDFSTLGLGLLSDAIQATTTEELNGQFIFEMDYPVSGNNADLIKENRIIVVNSGHILKRQGFIIRQIVRKIDLTMTVYAEHVSYATLDVALAPVGTISGDAKTALENWKRMLVPTVDFTVDSDILTTNSTLIGAPEFETARQGLGGHTGSILDVWGGEYQFDNWHIRLLKQRGKSANAIIAYGRNLISFEQDTNIADTYTSVYPYYQENSGDEGNKTHFLPERTVDSEFVGKYPNPKVLMLDLSNKFKDVADYSGNKLRNYALSYIQSNNIGVPKVNMKISTVDLSRATGGFSEDIDLGDTVKVYFEKLGITTSAKVIKAVWNVLSDDYDKFEIGARRSSLTESISELATTADENANKALNQALVALQSADGKSTIYYLNSSDPWPTNPNENDTAFVKDGENGIMYRYMFNNDTGMFSWVKILDSMSADQIKQRVSDALESGKAYSDQLVADNVAQVNAVLDDVQAKQADLTAQQAELDTKAQGYANKALADAKANTLATATQTAKDASDALAKAKTDLTTSLNKEVTDRANAVTALDTKAKGYANTAKADAIATANGAVAKEVTDRQKAITDLDAKSTGAINQAKTDAQSALDALQVGGRNLVIKDKLVKGWMGDGVVSSSTSAHAMTTDFVAVSPNSSLVGQIWYDNTQFDVTNNYLRVAFYDSNKTYITRTPLAGTGSTTYNKWLITTPANTAFVRMSFDWLGDGYGHAKLEIGNKATDYTQAPEDIVLDYTTKDNVIIQSLTQYQATNDGKVTKAQSDATQALGLVATKVSQTDYNTKTGDLDSKYTAVKQTADQASTDIVAIKSTNTSQDTKINTLTSDVSGTKQSISDIQTEQGKQSTKINTIQTDVSGTKQDISDIKDANGVQDGKIASISTTVDGLSSSFSTYKTTNDGKVAKAQADITANATAISQKVSQTAYDAKTGQLQTDLNTTTTTANQAKTDIVAIKKTNTDQDTRMTTIESDANGTKTTVSNLQTDLGKANGSISTLQQRADGFDATVTKVNNLSVGGRNLFLNSKTLWNVANNGNGSTKVTFDDTTNMWHITAPAPVTAGRGIYFYQTSNTSKPLVKGDKWAMSIDIKGTGMLREFGAEGSTNQTQPTGPIPSEWTRLSSTGTAVSTGAIIIYFGAGADTTQALDVYVKLPKLELGTIATAWSPAPEDVDSATAKAQLTADNASLALNNYKSDADGRISKAQADIIVNANAITQKVSQSDYNAKTGDLTTKVNTAQSTADSATSTIGAYKTANDGRVASAESKITANATAITQKVSQTDYNTKTGQIDGQISTINQTAGKISQSVSNVKAQVDGLSVGGTNLFVLATASKGWLDLSYNVTASGDASLASDFIPVTANATYVAQQWYIMSHPSGGGYLRYAFYDSTKKPISRVPAPANNSATYSKWVITIPANASFIRMSFDYTDNNGSKVKFEQGNMPTDWTPAPEDTDNKISTVSQTVDSISSIVSDPTTGLTKRIQTAEGSISTVQSNVSDLQSKQTQTANGLTTEISNRATGDTNTLTQAKDFTTSSITSSETGMKSLITQTSDSIIAKVDTKTDSDTVLSLLKDNWSIGIADNAGALASGIAGDLNGMTLISKKITLDGNTTVTGDFYAKGGNFKNLNASNITAGNLDADEVRIINLDVNTLTGDVSMFLETNWNGAYGSTKITSTGMKINTQYIQADFQGFGMDFSYSNKKIGGMGISQYLNGEPGLSMRLESNGAYMAWSARNEGDSTGSYIDKLAWYRQRKPALGGNYGFIFSDRVTFNKPINVEGASINLGFRPINLYGNNFPFFGNQDNITGFAYTSNEIYMVLQNQYVNLSNVIKALSGLGAWSVPTNIDSTGKVTQWRNVTT
ncbi:phage tail spike protein [Leuconostoc lactis]|uniref:phage tail spike protein n=1 Tax=Leuconostoc lactis TaxID=1246 RepID=UPI0024ADAB6A|nr:phage tail spike protein [Leuconostoc lactis]MDI6496587.1 phage tail spike protein [Leuconostoc lactis]